MNLDRKNSWILALAATHPSRRTARANIQAANLNVAAAMHTRPNYGRKRERNCKRGLARCRENAG